MMRTLEEQLRFVRVVQGVDTVGVEPWGGVGDDFGERDGLDLGEELGEELGQKGEQEEEEQGDDGFGLLGQAERKLGRFVVVDTGTGTETGTKEEGERWLG